MRWLRLPVFKPASLSTIGTVRLHAVQYTSVAPASGQHFSQSCNVRL